MSDIVVTILVLIWAILPLVFGFLWLRARKRTKASQVELKNEIQKTNELEERFSSVLSVEDEARRLTEEKDKLSAEMSDLRADYREKRAILNKLKSQVAIFDERLSFAELGVYEPHFDFGDSETYKEKIKEVRDRQKKMVSAKEATICPTDWTVDGSRSKGQTMINRQTRLTMRAFNNECEAAIANTRWNNAVAMEKRILNAAKQINSANDSMKLVINENYIALKIDELHLTHEYREQLKAEKEERAELARAEREEKKLLAEAAAADKEEKKYLVLLAKAREEANVDKSRISELEEALALAHEKGERARSMAQMTKSGYVYIISNIGSFGESIVKIGLTRRLDPDDRVKELGDASVPFGFDTHAMIYSEEAPALEAALHKEFEDVRVNAANMRKEFFRTDLDSVEKAVERLAPDANFFKDREAQEWQETLARRKEALEALQDDTEEFPEEI